MTKDITILGGGIAGLTTAIALRKTGFNPLIFEAAPEIKTAGAGLALSANAMMALNHLGIMDEIIEHGRLLPSFSVYDRKGKIISSLNSQKISLSYGVDNFTIHRADLHKILLSEIIPNSIHTGKKAVGIEQTENKITITFEDGSKHATNFLIAADGIHSVVRKQLLPRSEPRYAGYTCWRAVIDNSNLQLSESSETWGENGRFGIVPLADKKVYWFACINAKENSEQFRNFKILDLQKHFSDFHNPIPAVLFETENENLIWNDILEVKPLNRFAFGKILLIGDAAHATTPNLGQGACQAIEDAVILGSELQKNSDFTSAFKSFEKRRLPRTKYITNTSRRVGKIAQIENRYMAAARNFLFRNMPAKLNEQQLDRLYNIDFD